VSAELATVAQVSPLRVLRSTDGASVPVQVNAAGTLALDDVVVVQTISRKLVVVARIGGPAGASHPDADHADTFSALSHNHDLYYSAIGHGPHNAAPDLSVKGAKAWRSAALNIANNSQVSFAMDTEMYDNGGYWVVGSPNRFTVPAGLGGLHRIAAHVIYGVGSAGLYRQLYARFGPSGGFIELAEGTPHASSRSSVYLTCTYPFNAGDTIDFYCWQDSGAINAPRVGADSCWIEIEKVGH
jgi:hypothetical protein